MNKKVESVVKELTKRFVANNFKAISLVMKCNGECITITPCGYDIKSIKDIEYFLIGCSIPWLGNESLEEVANFLVNYQEHLLKRENSKNDLYKFFLDHIKGHTSEELNLGNDICSACYDIWDELPEDVKQGITYIFDKKLERTYLTSYHNRHPEYTMAQIIKAFDLSTAFECYSDWYKDVNGYRPRSLSDF